MIRALLLALSLTALTPPTAAQPRDLAHAIAIDVLPGWRRDDGVQVAALRVRLAPGWRTYWRRAGAAGISPRMDWRGSRGLRSVTPAWPTPTVFGRPGALSIGYERDFVLPLLVQPAGPGPVRLDGVLDIGVCAEICLPARVRLAADLPPGRAPDPAIEAALADRPVRVERRATCALRPVEDGLEIAGEVTLPPLAPAEAVVFELPDPEVWVTDAHVTRRGDRLRATAEILAPRGRPLSVDRAAIRITVIGAGRAVEIAGCAG